MKIRELNEDEISKWDELVENSDDSWLFHLHAWGELIDDVFGSATYYLVAEDGNELIGVFPVTLRKKSCLKWFDSGSYGYGGFAFSPNLNEQQKKEVSTLLLAYTRELAKRNDAAWLRIRLPPLAASQLPPKRPDSNPLIEYGFQDIPSYGFMVSLENPIDSLWDNLGNKTRNIIRKAEKNGVEVSEADSRFSVDDYYALHLETCKRTGAAPFPKAYYESIAERFGKKGRQHFFIARKGSNVLAALSVGSYKSGVHYWSGASKSEALKLGCNDLLQWSAIKWAKENGYRWYDNGDVHPFSKNKKLQGIYKFKGSFGGVLTKYYKGILVYSPLKKLIADIGKKVLGNGTEL